MDDFEKKMENLQPPQAESPAYQRHFRMYLLNSRPTALLGFGLLMVPLMVLAGMLLRYQFGMGGGWLADFADYLAHLDAPVLPFIMLGAPLLALILNLLAVLHFHYDKAAGEFSLTIRLKWGNVLLLLLCTAVLGYLFLFLLVENIHHP